MGACSIKLDILVPEGRYFSIGSNLSLNSTAGDEHEDRPDSEGFKAVRSVYSVCLLYNSKILTLTRLPGR